MHLSFVIAFVFPLLYEQVVSLRYLLSFTFFFGLFPLIWPLYNSRLSRIPSFTLSNIHLWMQIMTVKRMHCLHTAVLLHDAASKPPQLAHTTASERDTDEFTEPYTVAGFWVVFFPESLMLVSERYAHKLFFSTVDGQGKSKEYYKIYLLHHPDQRRANYSKTAKFWECQANLCLDGFI